MSSAISAFLQEVDRRTVGAVHTDITSRTLYSTDASLYQVMPLGVLIPEVMDDVHAAVELATKYRVPVLPRTGGSSLAGQATNEALVIDFTRHLTDILEVNTEERWVRVQPGRVLDELNLALLPHGLQFGPDPASSNRAAVGGIVSNNSTGSHSILYGMTADHVLEVDAFLTDGQSEHFRPLTPQELAHQQQRTDFVGQIYRQMNALVWEPQNQATIAAGTPQHWRRCGGYGLDRLLPAGFEGVTAHPLWPRDGRFNLAKLFSGAEGTLGVLSEVKLNLVPRPEMTTVAVIAFDESTAALDAVPAILEVGPSAVEMMDNIALGMCREVLEYRRLVESFLEGTPYCILITEFYGRSEAELSAKLDRLETHLKQHVGGVTGFTRATDPRIQQNVWKVRKGGLGLLMSIRGDYKPIPIIEDSAVPVDRLTEYVTRLERFCESLGTRMTYYAHASAGCLHIRPLISTKVASEIAKLPQITSFAVELLGEYKGAFSSEHGDGKARSWANERFYGADLYALYKQTKGIFDPYNLFNPGNIVDAPPMTENLRYGAHYQTIPLRMHLDFSSDGGFDQAVEMCNGAGVCRKMTTGTMCPSFMATRDELDSTRGRANMLRAALAGQLDPDAFTGPEVKAAMDLCISCKACKSECPSSVDMAKIKAEWQAHYYEAHGTPLRARFFANVARFSRLAAGPFAPIVNGINSWRATRWILSQGLGITAERPLPAFAFRPFTSWFKRHRAPSKAPAGTVVLFNDTFNTYQYPQVAKAAVEVLEAAGYRVLLPGVTDAGRPALSKGLIARAEATANEVLTALAPFAADGMPIIFLEPSELSAVVDDYAALRPGDERVPLVASQCLSFEAFIAQQAEAGTLRLTFSDQPVELLLHGHCHQKALVGTDPSHKALMLPPNVTLAEVDSGCCGMAGSFGYEKEHLDLSLEMAERRLLPAVRQTTTDTIIVAAGVSCREQIHYGTHRRALHPAQFLRRMLT